MKGKIMVNKRTYAGLFMVTLATLMYEILLTRIFSVTMWYHFAFMAVSVAMFGMTVGALLVYLLPKYFTEERARYHLALSSFVFVPCIVVSFLIYLKFPVRTSIASLSSTSLLLLLLSYTVISLPFIASGVCVCIALTKFPRYLSRLYAVDLAGAALGCILVIGTLEITDAPTAVFVVACLAGIGSVLFAADARDAKLERIARVSCVLLGALAIGNTFLVSQQRSLLRLEWAKGSRAARPLYEKWNAFSHITVQPMPAGPASSFLWGLAYSPDQKVSQLYLTIDAAVGTVLTPFNGDLDRIQYLKSSISNLAHHMRPRSTVFVVGSGGGVDVLSALAFKQKSVVALEYNGDILRTANERFGDFTGHLDEYPQVSFVNDEARSYITRVTDKFDIIQISLIDTWAATAAGAFVLTENSLYTVEAWMAFLRHLTPRGILTVTRLFKDTPAEVYRATSLASASLMKLGVKNTRDHILIARCITDGRFTDAPSGMATILVSKEPFTDIDLAAFGRVCRKMRFDVVLSPKRSLDPIFATLASREHLDTFAASFPINIAPPTDDSPFFFHMLRLRDVFDPEVWKEGHTRINMRAVSVLGILLIVVVGLTFLCIIVPLILTTRGATLSTAMPLMLFFASIGCGFMLIEISQMQRLILFLGHPIYSLSVVLFSLLLSSGLGSYLTQRITGANVTRAGAVRLLLLLVTLTTIGMLTSHAIGGFQGSATALRILVAIGILSPLGLFMGMAFPLGMKLASDRAAVLTPWLWGINGATSVCASVLAVAIALAAGISSSFWTGVVCYVVAFGAFLWASRGKGG